jgi:hypothetical protein
MFLFFMMYKKYYLVTLLITIISYLTPLINILIFDKGIKENDFKVLLFSVILLLVANILSEIFKILQVM